MAEIAVTDQARPQTRWWSLANPSNYAWPQAAHVRNKEVAILRPANVCPDSGHFPPPMGDVAK